MSGTPTRRAGTGRAEEDERVAGRARRALAAAAAIDSSRLARYANDYEPVALLPERILSLVLRRAFVIFILFAIVSIAGAGVTGTLSSLPAWQTRLAAMAAFTAARRADAPERRCTCRPCSA